MRKPYATELFWSQEPDLYTFIESRKKQVRDWIRELGETELTSESIVHQLAQFEIAPLELEVDKAEVIGQGSKKISVKGDPRFWTTYLDGDDDFMPSEEPYADGHYITFAIPFSGSEALLTYRPQTHPSRPFKAQVHATEIHVTVEDAVAFTEQSLSTQQRQIFSVLKGCADSAKGAAIQFNDWIKNEGVSLIEKRRQALDGQNSLIEKLGFKVRKRSEPPANVGQPVVRKKLSAFEQLKASKQTCQLDMPVYDEILLICRNMARVMELSPKAFVQMREEDLRFHFLVQLNAVFEGQATGETFNLGGKTDILIKYEGQNLFIAECKFWTGEKDFEAAIDQLIGYISWHDTKTALILFNRNKDFSSVLEKLRAVTLKHKNCVEELSYDGGDASFRFRFRHGVDAARTFLLTILAFDVPA